MKTSALIIQTRGTPVNTKQFWSAIPQASYGQCQNNQAFPDQGHINDLSCFTYCSEWELMILSSELGFIKGKVQNSTCASTNLINIHNVLEYLPLDIQRYQQFVYDKKQPKLDLKIEFNMEGYTCDFTNIIQNKYFKKNFGFVINAKLHNYYVLGQDITFIVKGDDVIKSIISKLLTVKSTAVPGIKNSNTNNNTNNKVSYTFDSTVFNSPQLHFHISFSILEDALAKPQTTIENSNIRITKIFIQYTLPLCSFICKKAFQIERNYYSNNISCNKASQIINNTPKSSSIMLKLSQQSSAIRRNFCNWNSFLTWTTPLIFEKADGKIIAIINSLKKPSLFGISPVFLYNGNSREYCQFRYYPVLHSLDVTYSAFISDSTSTDEGSVISGRSRGNVMTINYKFPLPGYDIPFLPDQVKKLLKMYPELEELKYEDICKDSGFSLIWIPVKARNVNKCLFINNYFNKTTFIVYYTFRGSVISNAGKYLQISNVNTLKGKIEDEGFWFTNQSQHANNNNNPVHSNRNYYL